MTDIKVKAKLDITNPSGTRVIAKKGRKGIVYFDGDIDWIGKSTHIKILWDGNNIKNDVPAWQVERI